MKKLILISVLCLLIYFTIQSWKYPSNKLVSNQWIPLVTEENIINIEEMEVKNLDALPLKFDFKKNQAKLVSPVFIESIEKLINEVLSELVTTKISKLPKKDISGWIKDFDKDTIQLDLVSANGQKKILIKKQNSVDRTHYIYLPETKDIYITDKNLSFLNKLKVNYIEKSGGTK